MTVYICTGLFILFDILTGLMKAWYNRNLDSTKLRQGMFNKLSEIAAVLFLTFVEYGAEKVGIPVKLPTVIIGCAYICITEAISIIENLCTVNPKLLKVFQKYLNKLKESENNDEDV